MCKAYFGAHVVRATYIEAMQVVSTLLLALIFATVPTRAYRIAKSRRESSISSSRISLSSALISTSSEADVEVAAAELDVPTEMAKLFNRMSDKYMLLDVEGAGSPGMINCCHSGCDNCEFRFRFDEMSAGRAKWVPLYADRKHIDGRYHVAPWAAIFFDNNSEFEKAKEEVSAEAPFLLTDRGDAMSITMDRFVSKMRAMVPVLSLGPPSGICTSPPSTEFLHLFWKKLVNAADVAPDSESLSPKQMSSALEGLTKAEHGANWRQFSGSFEV